MRKLSILLLLLCLCSRALADGGRLRFSRASGPFQVTLFTSPEPLTPGPSDFSVMVQDRATGDILQDATVTLDLDQQDRHAHAIALHRLATNKLMQAADLTLTSSGQWKVHLVIEQAGRSSTIDESLTVEAGSRQAKIVWVFATLPVLAIFLFVLHQGQKNRINSPHQRRV